MRSEKLLINVLIVLVGSLLFIPNLGAVHLFDWDEINFAECAREMIVTGNYSQVMIDFQPFWEKPPLFFWLQVLAMKLFGINEFAARFPNALCGIITLLVLFNIGSRHFGLRFGLLWVIAFAGSFLPHFYFKSGIIDPWFNLFIFLGIYFFTVYSSGFALTFERRKPVLLIVLSALFIGLGILTKGPVALLIFGLCFLVFWIINRFKFFFTIKDVLIWGLVMVLTGSSWFIFEIARGRMDIIVEFIEYQVRLLQIQDAGHGGPFFYHFLVLLLGCFPASILAIRGHKGKSSDDFEQYFKVWMLILFWVVLILFSIVKTKIVHYSSLAYFPLTFLAAWVLNRMHQGHIRTRSWMAALSVIIGALIGIAITLLPFVDKYKEEIIASGIIKDDFAVANLQAEANWSGFEFFLGIFLLASHIVFIVFLKKKGAYISYVFLFIISLITVNLTALIYVPKIERYSQGAAIDFFKSKSGEDVYVETLFYKSYANLFYTDKMPPEDPRASDREWILKGDADKPVYAVAKITRTADVEKYHPEMKELYRKNGFVFYKKENGQ